MTDEEYQAHRKKLFAERSRVIKAAYERKMERIKRQATLAGNGKIDEQDASRSYLLFSPRSLNSISFFLPRLELEDDLEAQIRAEEEMMFSMMSLEEREEYIRARNEERARQRLLAERERLKREEELQAALAETKRMAALRAAEIMSQELQMRSANAMYAELQDLITEQKISRAFTYSYFSLLQYLSSPSNSST